MQIPKNHPGILHNLLFDDEDVLVSIPVTKPGRDPLLIEARDNFLIHRFYFKIKSQRKTWQDTLQELHDETYISKFQILKILQAKHDTLQRVRNARPTKEELEKSWPHIVWNLNQ